MLVWPVWASACADGLTRSIHSEISGQRRAMLLQQSWCDSAMRSHPPSAEGDQRSNCDRTDSRRLVPEQRYLSLRHPCLRSGCRQVRFLREAHSVANPGRLLLRMRAGRIVALLWIRKRDGRTDRRMRRIGRDGRLARSRADTELEELHKQLRQLHEARTSRSQAQSTAPAAERREAGGRTVKSQLQMKQRIQWRDARERAVRIEALGQAMLATGQEGPEPRTSRLPAWQPLHLSYHMREGTMKPTGVCCGRETRRPAVVAG